MTMRQYEIRRIRFEYNDEQEYESHFLKLDSDKNITVIDQDFPHWILIDRKVEIPTIEY